MNKETKTIKVITDRQWRNLNRELSGIKAHLSFLEENLPRKAKRYLTFEECIPPRSICKDVNSMMQGLTTYDGFLGRLSEYYGCETMKMLIDPGTKVSDKAIATYYHEEKTAYSKGPTVSTNTVLHEFFHHLTNLKVVVVDKKKEEPLADQYATAFLQRATSN